MYLYVLFTLFNSYGWHNGNWTHFSTNHQTELGQIYWGQVGKFPEVLDVNFVPGNADVSQPEDYCGDIMISNQQCNEQNITIYNQNKM